MITLVIAGTVRYQSRFTSLVTVVIPASVGPFALRRLGNLPNREIAIGRSVRTIRLRGSLGSPSRSHRCCELLATFWREIEFPLHLLRGASSFCACRFYLRFRCGVALVFAGGGGVRRRFLLRLCGVSFDQRRKFPFQFAKFLRPFQQPSLEATDLFFEGLQLHGGVNSAPAALPCRSISAVQLLRLSSCPEVVAGKR